MSSRDSTPLELLLLDLTASRSIPTPSMSSLPNAFELLGRVEPVVAPIQQDRYFRPTPEYNDNYNPYKPPNINKPVDYSPFMPREPLFDDRPIYLLSLRKHYTVTPAASWVRPHWI